MKSYVVFVGREVGIFDNWPACESRTKGFKGAIFKSYPDYKTAKKELEKFTRTKSASGRADLNYPRPSSGICSDASYLVKKNILEYRVVDIKDGAVLKHGIFEDTQSKYLTNIGEFFGLVHAIKYAIDNGLETAIYSDSVTAIKWVTEKEVKTQCTDNRFLPLIKAGTDYLKSIDLPAISKWQTDLWGEIPADFGRK